MALTKEEILKPRTDADATGTVATTVPVADDKPEGAGVVTPPTDVKTPEVASPVLKTKPTYEDMFKTLSPFKPKTAEEIEADRRKERRDKTFSAISDGISALSNLYFTTKGAPSSFDASQSLSAKARERYKRLQKEYDDNMKVYQHGYLQAQKMDEDAEYKSTLAKLKEQAQEMQRERDKNTAKAKEDANQTAKDKLEYQKDKDAKELQLKQQQQDERERHNREQEAVAKARAHKYVSGGSSSGGKHDVVYTPDGTYNVPAGFMAKNRGALMKAAGVEATEGEGKKKRNKSTYQIDKEIQEKWNGECTKILKASGGKTGGTAKSNAQTPAKTASKTPATKTQGNGSGSSQKKEKINW